MALEGEPINKPYIYMHNEKKDTKDNDTEARADQEDSANRYKKNNERK